MTSTGKGPTPRISLPGDDELPKEIRDVLGALPPLHVFRVMGRAPASFRPFLEMGLSVLARSELDPRLREIAVLRVAHVTGSHYEWVQHVAVARGAGVRDDEINAIACDGPVVGLDEEACLLCRVAEEISRDVRLSDEALAAALERFGERQTMELIVCCGHFNMVSRILESARVELEPDSVLGERTTLRRETSETGQ